MRRSARDIGCTTDRHVTKRFAEPNRILSGYTSCIRSHCHSKNLESLPMSYHFPCARPYALLTRPSLLLTQSKLPKCLREMLTQSYATQGFAYAEFDMTRSLLKMQRQVFRAAHLRAKALSSSIQSLEPSILFFGEMSLMMRIGHLFFAVRRALQ